MDRIAATECWEQDILPCSTLSKELYDQATLKQCEWYYDELKLIFQDGVIKTDVEIKFQKAIRKNGKDLIKKVQQIIKL